VRLSFINNKQKKGKEVRKDEEIIEQQTQQAASKQQRKVFTPITFKEGISLSLSLCLVFGNSN